MVDGLGYKFLKKSAHDDPSGELFLMILANSHAPIIVCIRHCPRGALYSPKYQHDTRENIITLMLRGGKYVLAFLKQISTRESRS